MGLIFISHDLRLVSSFCDRVIVMYAGKIVEELEASELKNAQHPYTQGLLNCMPQIGENRHPLPVLDRKPEWAAMSAALSIDNLSVDLRPLPRAEGCQRRCRTGRILRPCRRIRLRKIDAAARCCRSCARRERHASASTANRSSARKRARRILPSACRWSSRTLTARCTRARPIDRLLLEPLAIHGIGDSERRIAARWTRSGSATASVSAIRISFPAASASALPSPAP